MSQFRFAGQSEEASNILGGQLADQQRNAADIAIGGLGVLANTRAQKMVNEAQMKYLEKSKGKAQPSGTNWGSLAAPLAGIAGGLFGGGGGGSWDGASASTNWAGNSGGIDWNGGFGVAPSSFGFKGSFL